jgi:hypothetical protein
MNLKTLSKHNLNKIPCQKTRSFIALLRGFLRSPYIRELVD